MRKFHSLMSVFASEGHRPVAKQSRFYSKEVTTRLPRRFAPRNDNSGGKGRLALGVEAAVKARLGKGVGHTLIARNTPALLSIARVPALY